MARYTAITDGNFSTVGTWDTVTNTPTYHASTKITISSTHYTATFTAPNTTNACVGAIFLINAVSGSGYTYTVTLQENGIDTAAAKAISGSVCDSFGYIFVKFDTPYVFTSTTADYYKFKIVRSGSSSGNMTLWADSGGTLVAFEAIDNRNPAAAPTTGDRLWVLGANGDGTVSVTVDGTQYCGDSTTNGIVIGMGGLLKWDTAASATLISKGGIYVVGRGANKGELQIGTASTHYPTSKVATLTFDENGTGSSWGISNYRIGSRIQLHGEEKNDTSLWRTTYASGAGTVADPMVVADSVNWSTGDEICVATTTDNGGGPDNNEFFYITNVSATNYSLVSINKLRNPGFESGTAFSQWSQTAGNGAIAIETSSVKTGAKAAKITAGSSANTFITQDVYINAAASCTLSFWTRGDGTYAGQYQIIKQNGTPADIVAKKSTGVTGTTYTQVTETFTAPAGCTTVRIVLYCPATNTGVAYFDDVSVTYVGLQYTHSTSARIVNVTRNVLVNSTNDVDAWGGVIVGAAATSGDIDCDWTRLDSYSGTFYEYGAEGKNVLSVDYTVFYNPMQGASAGVITLRGQITSETFTGNVLCKCPLFNGLAMFYYSYEGTANKNLVDTLAIGTPGYAYYFYGVSSMTFTRVISINCNSQASSARQPFFLAGANFTFTDCEAHAGGNGSLTFQSSLTYTTFTRFLSGTKGTNNTTYTADIYGLGTYYFNVLWDTCTFQFSTPSLSSCPTGSEFRMQNYGGTNVDFVLTPTGTRYRTGTSLADTTVHTDGGFADRFAPSSSTLPLKWIFTIPTGNISTYQATLSVWVKINNAAYYAGTHQNPKITVDYDNGTTTTVTASDTTDWQQLSKSFTPTTSYGVVTVTIEGMTDATGTNAYFYVDDMALSYPSGYAVNLGRLDLWSFGNPITPTSDTTGVLSIVWADDPYVVDTEAEANAFTGIALNYTAKTITVTEDHSLTHIYEYCKASARTNGVLLALSTKDGITYTLSGGWTLLMGANTDISGTANFNLNSTSLSMPTSGSFTPILMNGTLVLSTAGTITANMNGITIDYQGDGTFDHSASSVLGTVSVDTTTDNTVTATFAGGTSITNLDEAHITVNNATSVTITITGTVSGSQVRVWETVSGDELINETSTGADISTSYVYTTPVAISILVRKSSSATKYLEWTGAGTITSAGASVAVVQIEDSNINATTETATGWAIAYDTKIISVSGTPDTLTTNELYTWLMDGMDTEANMVYANPMTCEVKNTSYTLRNGYTLDTDVEQYLTTGGIVTSDDDTIYTNVFTVGSLVASSNVYIKQDGAKITSWWSTGNIDVLIKVKTGGSLIDSGNLYFYVRKFNNTYEYVTLDASAGGRQVVAVANATDLANQTASGTVAGYSDIAITWGAVNKDLGDGEGAKPYDVSIDAATRTVEQVYEYLKYVCRDGETAEQNSVDGELYLSASPATYTLVKTGPFGSMAGSVLFGARGVWIENLDTTDDDEQHYVLTDSDGGTHTHPLPPVYISLTGIVAGSRVQIYNVTTDEELFNDIVAGTTKSLEYTPGAGDETIRVRATYVDGSTTAYLFYEANLTANSTGGSAVVAQVEDTVYETNAIDGSAITSCSVSGTTIKVFVDEADNAINIQDIYNWYCYMLFTESGIRDQGWNLRAVDTTNYIAYNTLLIHNDGGDPLLLGGGYILQNTGGTALDCYDTTGDPIFMGYNHAVGVGSGLSTAESTKLMSLKNPSLLIDNEIIV